MRFSKNCDGGYGHLYFATKLNNKKVSFAKKKKKSKSSSHDQI